MVPKRVNPGLIARKKSALARVSKFSPDRAELVAEIEAAEAEVARWDAFVAWVLKAYGASPNVGTYQTPAATYSPGTLFVRMNLGPGKNQSWTFEALWEEYRAAIG